MKCHLYGSENEQKKKGNCFSVYIAAGWWGGDAKCREHSDFIVSTSENSSTSKPK